MKTRQNAEMRKPEIIRSFYETILEEGFEGASIAKVAKRLDIHSTLILHYFGNKENMTLALVDFVVEEYSILFKKIRTQRKNSDPEERMVSFFQTIWSKPYYEKIDIAASLSVISVSFRNSRVQKKIQWLYQQFKTLLIQELEELSNRKAIETQDVERTANVLLSMVEGSRHFRHFFVKTKEISQYNRDMAMAAIQMVKCRAWQEDKNP
ncbi:MAG: TetR/AcrR family transcriptional regulator [Desulfobacteraceae bacterium]|nr:MAG: TetR/AcrR family transcriptional regulator [Desulfobacteraceae bacterium]